MPDASDREEQAIHARSVSCLDAMNRGDIDAVVEHYTEDAVLIFPSEPIIQGRANIRSYWESVSSTDRAAQLQTLLITCVGDLACEVGQYEVTTSGEQSAGNRLNGKNVVVWRKQEDGTWRLAVDVCVEDPD